MKCAMTASVVVNVCWVTVVCSSTSEMHNKSLHCDLANVVVVIVVVVVVRVVND